MQKKAKDDVVTKHKLAAEILNKALAGLTKACEAGKTTLELCQIGDNLVKLQCESVYKNKKNEDDKPMQKGTAFPTCVSVNDCACHNSPLLSEAEPQTLAEGDVVKIDLGCHIDGYLAVAAHTVVVGAADAKVTGKVRQLPVVVVALTPRARKTADVCLAALHAAHAAIKTVQVGATNYDVTRVIKQVADAYGVNACQGVLMHQLKRCVFRTLRWTPLLPL